MQKSTVVMRVVLLGMAVLLCGALLWGEIKPEKSLPATTEVRESEEESVKDAAPEKIMEDGTITDEEFNRLLEHTDNTDAETQM